MDKLKDPKVIIIICLTLVIVSLSLVFSVYLLTNHSNSNKNEDTTKTTISYETNKKYYGTITRVDGETAYFKANGSDEEESTKTNNSRLATGDKISFEVDENGNKYWFKVIYEDNGKEYTMDLYEYRETNTRTTAKTEGTQSTSIKNTSRTTTIVPANQNPDDTVLNYIKDKNDYFEKSKYSEDIKKQAKEYFVSLVDFIFYGGSIKGKTFKELSSSAKEKVIYGTLKIDGIIDKHIPGYKETLGNSYKNAKKDLIVLYTDTSTKLCAERKELCDDLKNDVNDLKKSLNLTWDIIYDIYVEMVKPLGVEGIKKLTDWYEVWKNA